MIIAEENRARKSIRTRNLQKGGHEGPPHIYNNNNNNDNNKNNDNNDNKNNNKIHTYIYI